MPDAWAPQTSRLTERGKMVKFDHGILSWGWGGRQDFCWGGGGGGEGLLCVVYFTVVNSDGLCGAFV